jgi:hypothetical protein
MSLHGFIQARSPKTMETLMPEKFMPIFEFVGEVFFPNKVLKFHEDFAELVMRVFLENGLGSFQIFLILQI